MYPHISPESILGRGQYGRRSLFIFSAESHQSLI